jgi:integrase
VLTAVRAFISHAVTVGRAPGSLLPLLYELGTPIGELKLLPTDRRNPHGRNAVTAFTFGFAHRAWVGKMPVLRTSDGTEFDKRRIFPYAYRHTYAQRHADAGMPIDVLRELMDHRKLDTTRAIIGRRETPPRSRRLGRRHAVRPARQPDLAHRPGAARF